MASAILTRAATVICTHGGDATPAVAASRVTASGAPVVTIDAAYAISGCPFVPPAGDGPCVTGLWIAGASRVSTGGRPVAVADGASVCAPTGTAMIVVASQGRVRAL